MKWPFIMLLVPLLSFAGHFPTAEVDCTHLDLRNETLGKVRDQQEMAWCYAFTAADMLAYTFDINHPKISAADVAIGYNDTGVGRFSRWLSANVIFRNNQEVQMSAHETGFNKIALFTAMKNGWCPEEVFPSEEWTKYEKSTTGYVKTSLPLKKAMHEIAKLHKSRHQLTLDNLPYYFSFKNVDAKTFLTILNQKNLSNVYSSLKKAVCQNDRSPFDYNWKVRMVLRHPQILERLSEQLELGRIVGMDYDSRILLDRKHSGVGLKDLHTSSIVGRRWNKNSQGCQFLVRNSYGANCFTENYDPSYDCEDGNIWLDEGLMYSNMASIVYMMSRVK